MKAAGAGACRVRAPARGTSRAATVPTASAAAGLASHSSGEDGAASAATAAAAVAPPAVLLRCLSAVNESTKWGVSATCFVILLYRHDLPTTLCLAGSIANAAFCKVTGG